MSGRLPLDFGLQPPGPGEQVPLASSPQPVGTYSGPRTLVLGGCSEAPRVCLEAHGCLELGLGETGGTPTSCRSSHLGLLLPEPVPVTSHSQGFSTQAGGQGTLCLLGTGRGSGLPGPSPWWCWGGASFRRPNLKVWTAAFPKALGSPRSTRDASTDQGSVRVSWQWAWAFLPGRRGRVGPRILEFRTHTFPLRLLPEGAANERENG